MGHRRDKAWNQTRAQTVFIRIWMQDTHYVFDQSRSHIDRDRCVLWLVNNYIPMDGKIKQIINVVVVIAVVVWLIQVFIGPLPDLRVGR